MGPSEAGAASHTVTFTARRPSFNSVYPDVGSIRLNVKDASGAQPITGASNNFVTSPADFLVQAIAGNPGTTYAVGPGFRAAGAAFPVTVHVVNSLGGLTPNYGNETPAERIQLSPVLVNPAIGAVGLIGSDEAFTGTGGVFTGTSFHWSEAGSIRLRAEVANNLYLTAVDLVGTNSVPVGRFYPRYV